MANAELGGALRFVFGQVAEVVAEPVHGTAVEACPKRRFTDGDATTAGHAVVVVGDAGDHVDVGVEVVHFGAGLLSFLSCCQDCSMRRQAGRTTKPPARQERVKVLQRFALARTECRTSLQTDPQEEKLGAKPSPKLQREAGVPADLAELTRHESELC